MQRNPRWSLLLSIGLVWTSGLKLIAQSPADNLQYYCLNDYPVLGKGWSATATRFSRLPVRWQSQVTDQVWQLASNSAGLMVAFRSNAQQLKIRWRPLQDNHMPHMTDVGTKGLDLYAWSESAKKWRWAGSAKSFQKGPIYTADLVTDLDSAVKNFLLYLPLYDGLDSLWIGIPPAAFIQPVEDLYTDTKPIVFYGTSITQGGCASRPGMSYPAIIGRELDLTSVNLGFSGAGKMELPMAQLLAEIDAAVYVIDCLPNMTPEMVAERVVPFVQNLRNSRPETPIILISTITYENTWLRPTQAQMLEAKNANLLAAYRQLQLAQVKNLNLVISAELQIVTADATVDGAHLTDVGFLRLAKILIPHITQALKL